jgi:hypothetical protein
VAGSLFSFWAAAGDGEKVAIKTAKTTEEPLESIRVSPGFGFAAGSITKEP